LREVEREVREVKLIVPASTSNRRVGSKFQNCIEIFLGGPAGQLAATCRIVHQVFRNP
jgi:hypothetical protein